MKRRRLTERQVIRLLIMQGCKLKCLQCGKPILLSHAESVEREHVLPIGLGGKDDLQNMGYSHRGCHLRQTATDKAMIAKADRQRRHHETGRSSAKTRVAKIKSRGFDKTLKKRMDGTVERREP